MTDYATHRFSVGQQVTHSSEPPIFGQVVAQLAGADGPEYRVRFGRSEIVVHERELTYRTDVTSPARPTIVVH
jgi:hypothetical protein